MKNSNKKKTWTYHTSLAFKHEGVNYTVLTQLYSIGIYVILNNAPSSQTGFNNPTPLVKEEKRIAKDFADGKITDLVFGRKITVTTDDSGFLIEV